MWCCYIISLNTNHDLFTNHNEVVLLPKPNQSFHNVNHVSASVIRGWYETYLRKIFLFLKRWHSKYPWFAQTSSFNIFSADWVGCIICYQISPTEVSLSKLLTTQIFFGNHKDIQIIQLFSETWRMRSVQWKPYYCWGFSNVLITTKEFPFASTLFGWTKVKADVLKPYEIKPQVFACFVNFSGLIMFSVCNLGQVTLKVIEGKKNKWRKIFSFHMTKIF